MRRAIELAREGDRKPGGSPIGCVIVLDGRIVGEGHNETIMNHDPTAHVMEGGVLANECASLYYGPDDDPPFEEQANL